MLKFLANLLANKNKKPSLKQKPAAYVEFTQGHWAVQLRNPGSDKWTYVIDFQKKINIYNDFGDLMGARPVIQSFDSYDQAAEWVTSNISGASFEKSGALNSSDAYVQAIDQSSRPVFGV